MTSEKTQNSTKFFYLNELNAHFVAVFSQHSSCSTKSFKKILDFNNNELINVFSFQKVNQTQLLSVFNSSLAKSQGNSPDNIPLKHLSRFFILLLPALTSLFNLIIETGKYPQAWKLAYIVPHNKRTQPTSLNDLGQ